MSFGGDHGIPVAEENPYGVGIAVPGAGGYYQASPPTMTHHQQQPPPHQPFIPNAQPTYQQQQFVPPQPTFGAGGAGIAQPQLFQNFQNIAQNPIAQIGIGQASAVFNQANATTASWIKGWTTSLRYYFSVDNKYVLNKLKILLFPFAHKQWTRQRDSDGASYLPPSQDVNAPDLYLPSMAFITYILLVAFFMGATLQFTPEVLGKTASTGIAVLVTEILLLKLGFYLLNFPSPYLLDLVAYCGYKFVGITIILLFGLFLGKTAFFIAFAVHFVFMATFMMRTLGRVVLPRPYEETSKNSRNHFLLIIVLLQGVLTFFLCYLDFSYGTANTTLTATATGGQQTVQIPVPVADATTGL